MGKYGHTNTHTGLHMVVDAFEHLGNATEVERSKLGGSKEEYEEC